MRIERSILAWFALAPFALACGTLLSVEPDPALDDASARADGGQGSDALGTTDGPTGACGAVNLQSDPNNCGSCGRACTAAEACLQGACIPASCSGGGTTRACATDAGTVACVDLATDVANCGACAHACNFTDCASGECERAVFVTAATHAIGANNFVSLTTADQICQKAAAAGGLKNVFLAWLSDANDYPAKRFKQSARRYLLAGSGTPVASSFGVLTSGTLLAAIGTDELARAVTDTANVWTGTRSDGHTAPGNHCGGWSSTAATAVAGDLTRTDAAWTESTNGMGVAIPIPCAGAAHLYCFEQ